MQNSDQDGPRHKVPKAFVINFGLQKVGCGCGAVRDAEPSHNSNPENVLALRCREVCCEPLVKAESSVPHMDWNCVRNCPCQFLYLLWAGWIQEALTTMN